MIHGFMVVMYVTKVYGISIDHCLYWGMQLWYVHWFVFWWSWVCWCEKYAAWVYRYITAPS